MWSQSTTASCRTVLWQRHRLVARGVSWFQILQNWCNDHNSSFPKGLVTRLNVVGAVPLWWIIGLELLPQALLIPPTANLGKRPREQVVPYVDTAFGDGQLHAKSKPAAAEVKRKTGKTVLGQRRDNHAKAGDESAEMIAKVEKLRTHPDYRNVGLSFEQAKTIVQMQDAADAAGQQRTAALLSKEEIDTSELVGEFDFAVLDKVSRDEMRTELPSWDLDQRSSPLQKKNKSKTGQPKGVDCNQGIVEGEFAVLTSDEIQEKTAQEKKKKQRVHDSTWINKWGRFTSAIKQPATLDMSTRALKLALCQRLVSFFRSVRKVSAAKAGALPRDIYYPASTYAGMYWALQRMYKAEYQEQYYLVEERDRPPIIDWGSDADLMAIVNPVITVEMKMANTRLGSAIHDHEIQTLPVNTFKQLQSSGVFTLKTGEGINNLLCYQMQVYHGIRGGAHLHRLTSSDFHYGRDAIMDERFVKLSDAFTNKTWEPTVKVPQQKRECPPAYEVKEDPMVCGVFLVENLHMVRPTIIKSNPEKQVPENLFLKPIPIRQLPKGWEKAPFGSIKLFHPIPMGNKSIAKIVPSWFSELYQRSMLGVKSDGQSKHFTNSSCRHLLAQVLRENEVSDKVRLGSGGWRSEAGMANYGCSSRMALHDAFQMKSGATVVGDAARAQEYRERKDAEAAEWGMRSLQGSFGRLKFPLTMVQVVIVSCVFAANCTKLELELKWWGSVKSRTFTSPTGVRGQTGHPTSFATWRSAIYGARTGSVSTTT